MAPITSRYDFVLLFDVTNGNPNGDPDAGNMPRLDPETGHGLVTDVCLKRKVRNFVGLFHGAEQGFGIYVQEGAVLNERHRDAYRAVRAGEASVATAAKLAPRDADEEGALRRFMCRNFYDVRAFGAVMGTGINCGQVRGPVQLAFARSVEPVFPMEVTITRMAATSPAEHREGGDAGPRRDNRTIGRKHVVPYGLYRVHGHVSAKLAERTGFDGRDLDVLWTALGQMFEHDRSASRGEMASRRLVVFRHANSLGDAAAAALFDRVTVTRRAAASGASAGPGAAPARRYADYEVAVDRAGLPARVEVLDLL